MITIEFSRDDLEAIWARMLALDSLIKRLDKAGAEFMTLEEAALEARTRLFPELGR